MRDPFFELPVGRSPCSDTRHMYAELSRLAPSNVRQQMHRLAHFRAGDVDLPCTGPTRFIGMITVKAVGKGRIFELGWNRLL